MRVCLFGLLLVTLNAFSGESIDRARLLRADDTPNDWLTHGRTYAEERQSPLSQITTQNVGKLGLAWYFDTGTHRGLEASPLVIDGIIYTTASWSKVFALDGSSGEVLWDFDPKVPRAWGVNACCDVVNRGVAAWGDNVYLGTLDGRLVALNRQTGAVVWETLTIDPKRPYTITGAPRVINGKVIIGNGGAEYGVRGYVSAYDANTGELRWRFYTVPGNPELPFESDAMAMAAETWTGDLWWKVGGGGTVWDSMAYDPETDLLYVGVGNGSPWNRHIRSPDGGDNLFLSSIVALRARTGEYVWHYQTTPEDSWDFTATQHMILAELEVHGVTRKVIMQAPKNGFFYVLDRTTGELLSAEKYVPSTWASHVDMATGRPIETAVGNHRVSTQVSSPAPFGGHNWQPMAFNDALGLVYIPIMENRAPYSTVKEFTYLSGGHWNTGQQGAEDAGFQPDPQLVSAVTKRLFKGALLAWDPVQQEAVWQVQHPTMWNGGVLTTRTNLVFQGTGDGRLVAYDGQSGELLWQTETHTGVVAPPISYAIDGEQYIAVMAGWGGAVPLVVNLSGSASAANGRLLVYKLGASAQLPEPSQGAKNEAVDVSPVVVNTTSAELVARGQVLYENHCGRCHGVALQGGGLLPDLRDQRANTPELFDAIVLDGALNAAGMVSFADVLSTQDTQALYAYIADGAQARRQYEQSSPLWRDMKAWFLDKAAVAVLWLL